MSGESDNSLLRRYAETGDQVAFSELARRHINAVYSAALRRVGGNAPLAEDVTQAVFTVLARQAQSLSRHTLLIGWLYATTRNHAVSAVRREQRRIEQETQAQIMNEIHADDAETIDWDRIRPLLDSLLDELKEPDRNAVLLRFISGRGFAEIGRTLRISEDAARMRVDRALGKLKLLLLRQGIYASAAALTLALAEQTVTAAPLKLLETVSMLPLASGPALAAAAGPVLFMTTTKSLLTGAVILAAMAGAGLMIHEARVRRQTDAALAAAQLSNQHLREQRRELAQRLAAMRAAGTAQTARAKVAVQPDPLAKGDEFLKRHPEVQAAVTKQVMAQRRSKYAALFKALKLSEEQIEQFLVIKQQGKDPQATFTSGPGDGFIATLPQTDSRLSSDAREQLRELLGPDGFQQYRDYDLGQWARADVHSVAAALALGNAPLSESQASQLTQLFSSNLDKSGLVNWGAVLPQASALLGPEQQAALKNVSALDAATHALASPAGDKPN